MDRTDLVRLRWRLTGAWLWPCFVTLSFVDAAVLHWLPPEGDSESAVGGWLIAAAVMLLAVVVLSPLIGALLRLGRNDMPRNVARNYAGTVAAFGVSLALLGGGIAHHHVVARDRAAYQDARSRAIAWLGDKAPAAYQGAVNLASLNLLVIQAPKLYRACVPNDAGTRYFCVVVDRSKGLRDDVKTAGTESNQLMDEGAN